MTARALMFALVVLAHPVAAQIRGDSTAVAAIERMMRGLGGRELWAANRTLQLEYRVWITAPRAQTIVEQAWRDLREPNQWIRLRGDSVTRVSVMTSAESWSQRNGVHQAVAGADREQSLMFWNRDFYTLLRRFAISDADLSVVAASDLRVVVHSRRHGELGWFEIASDGTPVRWGTVDGGEPLVYVYGPLRDFGRIRFPAWGANVDGSWRFEYVAVALHAGPIAPALLMRPPG